MLILGLDPGKTTGWALIDLTDRNIRLVKFGVEKNAQVDEIAELIASADIVVCEDFLVDPKMARQGNFDYDSMVAPQVIGKIELLCKMSKKQLSMQRPALKPPAYGFSGMKYVKGKKNQHWQDAFAHAVYYCVTKLGSNPVKSA